ncbi:MAG: hypothetical protein M3222_04225 [Thermoproteota archaeon]|nr:hypothetical protein [Thermoproteota archaeon]MDQ4022716.1 hypothetical protein [Thermoproteota archaeon]
MQHLPRDLVDYINNNFRYPAGIIGCRATNPEMSLDCCEYDIAIFNKQSAGNRFIRVGNHGLELITLTEISRTNVMKLHNMIIIQDDDNLSLSSSSLSSAHNVSAFQQHYLKVLRGLGKKSIINSLFYHETITKNIQKNSVLGAMWLKIAAYDFLEGILALSEIKPMPIHELNQIRKITIERQDIAEGIKIALECVGLERATRSTISRSIEAICELNSMEYDKELIKIKVNHLLEKGMISDCYYYLGKMGHRCLAYRDYKFLSKYIKLIQISMDLTKDIQQLERLHINLVNISKIILKKLSHYHSGCNRL